MGPLVDSEVCILAETLATGRALVGFLLGVDPLMDNQLAGASEVLSTDQTLVRFLSRVDSLMENQVRPLPEALPAIRALVGFLLPAVDLLVPLQVVFATQVLPTLGTLVQCFLNMGDLMRNNI